MCTSFSAMHQHGFHPQNATVNSQNWTTFKVCEFGILQKKLAPLNFANSGFWKNVTLKFRKFGILKKK